MIRKVKGGYKVVSHRTSKSFGTYPSYKKAKERLRLIKYFGKLNK